MQIIQRSTRSHRSAIAAIIAGFVLLLPNLLTPLRAEYDALVLMTLATHITDGKPPTTWAGPSVYPPGLPTLYSWIERAHFGSSAALVGANWNAYLAAAIAIGFIVRRETNAPSKWCTAVLTIVFGFVTIRYMTLPMTDAVYFGVATVAVAFLCVRSWASWIAGVICVAAAISVRRNGVALVPAAAFAAIDWKWARRLLLDRWHRPRQRIRGRSGRGPHHRSRGRAICSATRRSATCARCTGVNRFRSSWRTTLSSASSRLAWSSATCR